MLAMLFNFTIGFCLCVKENAVIYGNDFFSLYYLWQEPNDSTDIKETPN